jgi:cytochrome c553
MSIVRTIRHGAIRWLLAVTVAAFAGSGVAQTEQEDEGPSFYEDLKLVDNALTNPPAGALRQSLESCLKQRNHAVVLNEIGMVERARRALQYCFDSLYISRNTVARVKGPTPEELAERAAREYDEAITKIPDVDNGRALYAECAACHEPEGWGLTTGIVPQIAGQHRYVVIKQLADFRAGHRDSILMLPYASVEAIGGPQAVADVAEYISTLEISVENGKGPGDNLDVGERLFAEHCARCHGPSGEGYNDGLAPRIQAQHYKYLVRQFEWIRDGKRRNAGLKMSFIEDFSEEEMQAVLDYTSRLMPPEELRAPPGWKNPDFEP